MKGITVYGIKNCDTMKKAFAWLDAHQVEYTFHDYKKEGVPTDRLAAWVKNVGWEALINTRGPTYRKIPDAERENLNESRAIKLLVKYSSAIRRPVVQAGDNVIVGFDEKAFTRLAGRK